MKSYRIYNITYSSLFIEEKSYWQVRIFENTHLHDSIDDFCTCPIFRWFSVYSLRRSGKEKKTIKFECIYASNSNILRNKKL